MFNHETGQSSSRVGSRIYIDAVMTKVWLAYRTMTVNDDFSEVPLMQQKVLTDPKQIFFPLLPEWNAWPYAGMDKEEVSECERRFQTAEEMAMALR